MERTQRGVIALVGSGEFLPKSELLDRALLARLAAPGRVVVLPTASARDGGDSPARWARMGVEHFKRLGVEVESVMLLTREDAESSDLAAHIAAANFVYLSGGKPDYLIETLRGTPCWQAIIAVYRAGGVIAGCSAGAMALAGEVVSLPLPWRTKPALGLAPGLAVIPHFDELPGWLAGSLRLAPWRVAVAGVEGATGLVISEQGWTVLGKGSVTIFFDRRATRYHNGDAVPHS